MNSKQWVKGEFRLGDWSLQSGQVLQDARLVYLQRGEPNAPKDNIVLLPTYYGGAMAGNLPLTVGDSPLADNRWCLIIPAMLGAGESTSPSNAVAAQQGARFPAIHLADQVRAQQDFLHASFGNYRLALVAGWSLGGMQSLQWGCLFPERVQRIAAWCATARCYPNNLLFLLGLKAALQADPHSRNGAKPIEGLRAFARVYASRAYSPLFFRDQEFLKLGFQSIDDLLQYWEEDHLAMNHHDLLAVLEMWAAADVSANAVYEGEYARALGAITAPTLLMPSVTDQYFLTEEAELDAHLIGDATVEVLRSQWGHCAGGPGRESSSMAQVMAGLTHLLDSL
ncbi:MAG: homoserine acetyltransferase [Gammaproteobacteria bacterium HGW-Gammaproteobacteria-14]|nr:MAG: homoserine acetyltransferase [Gammaproteobacteria bacterium HGW-Gammaproteobacteria-14]